MNLSASLGLGAVEPTRLAEPAPQIVEHSRIKVKHNMAGYSITRTILEFAKWAHEQERFPTVDRVCSRFGVCRATAYRWTSELAETYGIEPPARSGPEAR